MDAWQTGRLLVATPALEDPNFHRSVVLVLDHDDEGALGVVLNRASSLQVGEALGDWTTLAADPPVLFGGGPVEPQAIVALGRTWRPDPGDGGTTILERIRLVDLEIDPLAAAEDLERVRVFAGYAGWGPGQLEDEIDQGAWFTLDADPGDVFTADPDGLWHAVLRRQPDDLALLATFPLDPTLN